MSLPARFSSAVFALVDTRHEYERVFAIYVPIAVGVFVVIVLAIAITVVRYRGRDPALAARWAENNRIEVAYALLLACVVAFLLYVSLSAEHQVDTVAARERPSVTIDVTGSKWEWLFRYPGYGIERASGTVGRQAVIVPAGRTVRFDLSSADVIHSFWIPELRFKRDLIPGTTERVTLVFDRLGVFGGQCAEFCGLRHADMVFTIRVVAPARFATWARSGGTAPS
jgi:cytochrome c oxidase subunit 2